MLRVNRKVLKVYILSSGEVKKKPIIGPSAATRSQRGSLASALIATCRSVRKAGAAAAAGAIPQ